MTSASRAKVGCHKYSKADKLELLMVEVSRILTTQPDSSGLCPGGGFRAQQHGARQSASKFRTGGSQSKLPDPSFLSPPHERRAVAAAEYLAEHKAGREV